MTAPDTHLAQRARELYGKAAERLDPAVGARLQAARLHALAAAHAGERRHFGSGARWLIPSGACAAVVLAAVTLWQPMQPSMPAGTAGTAQGSDLDNELPPDAAQTDPVLYQNLDFYGWLASTDQTAGRH